MKSKENAGKLQLIINKHDSKLRKIRTRELNKASLKKDIIRESNKQ
jgi:hypothetical protein